MLLRAPKEKIPNFWSNGPIELKFWHLVLIMRYSKICLRWSQGSTFGPKRWALLGLQRSKKFKNWLGPIFEVNFANLWNFGNFGSLASIFLWNWPDFCAKSDPVDKIFSNFKSKLKLPQIWCPISFWTFQTFAGQVRPIAWIQKYSHGTNEDIFWNTQLWVSDSKISAQLVH